MNSANKTANLEKIVNTYAEVGLLILQKIKQVTFLDALIKIGKQLSKNISRYLQNYMGFDSF